VRTWHRAAGLAKVVHKIGICIQESRHAHLGRFGVAVGVAVAVAVAVGVSVDVAVAVAVAVGVSVTFGVAVTVGVGSAGTSGPFPAPDVAGHVRHVGGVSEGRQAINSSVSGAGPGPS